jgi:hypothetical protein
MPLLSLLSLLSLSSSILLLSPILIDVTRCPHALSSTPIEEAVTPLPSPETTPPVTTLFEVVIEKKFF